MHALHDHERRSSRSGSSSSVPQWTNAEHFLFNKLSGLPTPATILTCVIKTQPALKSGSRRSAAMRCRSIGYSGLVHSVHQSDQSFSGNRSGCLCKHATANLWAKLKSPKLSSREDRSPSRSTANNQKCCESSSRSLSPCPLSYSNPCITSVYASHLHVFRSPYSWITMRRALRKRRVFDFVPSFIIEKKKSTFYGHQTFYGCSLMH